MKLQWGKVWNQKQRNKFEHRVETFSESLMFSNIEG